MLETTYHMRGCEMTVPMPTRSRVLDSHMIFPGRPPFFGLLQQGRAILDDKRLEKPIYS